MKKVSNAFRAYRVGVVLWAGLLPFTAAFAQTPPLPSTGTAASLNSKVFVDPNDDEASKAWGASIGYLGFLFVSKGSDQTYWNGSCTLVRNDPASGAWILTARHCLADGRYSSTLIYTSVKAGFSSNAFSGEPEAIEADISNVFLHPATFSDIALVKLRALPREPDGSLVVPCEFYNGAVANGDTVVVAGYGTTGALDEACYECGHCDGYARAARSQVLDDYFMIQTNHGLTLPGILGPGDSGGLLAYEEDGKLLQAGVNVSMDLYSIGTNIAMSSDPVYSGTTLFTWINDTIAAVPSPNSSMELQSPVGGESLITYGHHVIKWLSASVSPNVTIELWKGGAIKCVVAASAPNTGTFDWILTGDLPSGTDYRIHIATCEGANSDQSHADFSILHSQRLYSANMETDPGWTFDGSLWAWGQPTGATCDRGSDPTAGHTGSNVVGYNLNGPYLNGMASTEWATTPVFDCSNFSDVRLAFSRWLGVTASFMDHAFIAVSNDGLNWNTIWENDSAFGMGDTGWSHCDYDLSPWAAHQANVRIRWGMGPTDDSFAKCGWNIDDVVVHGNSTVADTTPPQGTVTINTGAAYTDSVQVTLTLSATDDGGSGLADMAFSTDGVNWCDSEPYTTSTAFELPDGDGNKTVYVQFRDGAGNVSAAASASIVLDTTAPVASDQDITTHMNQPVAITLAGGDELSGPVTVAVVSGPSHGVLAAAEYTPDDNYVGPDSLNYQVTDGAGNSATAVVRFTITDQAPVAVDQSCSTTPDQAVAVTLGASDPDEDAVTLSVVTGPAHGTLTGTAPNLTYTPETGFTGSDSLTFQATDGALTSNVGTVSITVNSALSTGSLTVTLAPEAAAAFGAWRIDGGDWHTSGETVSGLAAGAHTVSFEEISPGGGCSATLSWTAPDSQEITIVAGQTLDVTGTYTTGDKTLKAGLSNCGGDLMLMSLLAATCIGGARRKALHSMLSR